MKKTKKKSRKRKRPLSESKWKSVGIVRVNGVPMHEQLGDEHAQDIIHGRYNLKRAIEEEAFRQRAIERERLEEYRIDPAEWLDAHTDSGALPQSRNRTNIFNRS